MLRKKERKRRKNGFELIKVGGEEKTEREELMRTRL